MTQDEEQEIANAYDRDQLSLERPTKELLENLHVPGESTCKKDRRINIRVSRHDLEAVQRKAVQKGISDQAIISGVIHQYVEGDLLEKR